MSYSHGHQITIELLESVHAFACTVFFAKALHVGFNDPT